MHSISAIISTSNETWWNLDRQRQQQAPMIEAKNWIPFIIKTIISLQISQLYEELIKVIEENQPKKRFVIISTGIPNYDKSVWINKQRDWNASLYNQCRAIFSFFSLSQKAGAEDKLELLKNLLGNNPNHPGVLRHIEVEINPPFPDKNLNEEKYFHFFIAWYVITSNYELLETNENQTKIWIENLIDKLNKAVTNAICDCSNKKTEFSQDVQFLVQLIRSKILILAPFLPRELRLEVKKPIMKDSIAIPPSTPLSDMAIQIHIILFMQTLCTRIEAEARDGIIFKSLFSSLEKHLLEPWIFETRKKAILWHHHILMMKNTNNKQINDLLKKIDLSGFSGQYRQFDFFLSEPCQVPSFEESFEFFCYMVSYVQGALVDALFLSSNRPFVKTIYDKLKIALNRLKERIDHAPPFDEIILDTILYEETTNLMPKERLI